MPFLCASTYRTGDYVYSSVIFSLLLFGASERVLSSLFTFSGDVLIAVVAGFFLMYPASSVMSCCAGTDDI